MGCLQRGILLSLSLLGMTGCVHAITATLQSGFRTSDQWAGPVTPIVPNCGGRTTGQMTLGAKEFSFDPFGSIIAIQGNVEKDRLEGSAIQAAPGQQGIAIRFVGTIGHPANGPPVIQGTVKSGQCAWAVTLHRD